MRSIERLVIWLIPAEILGVILRCASTYFSASSVLDHGSTTMFATLSMLSGLAYLVGQMVIGIWLYHQDHESQSSRWIWSIFGTFVGFWALGIYLLIQIPSIKDGLQRNGDNHSRASGA